MKGAKGRRKPAAGWLARISVGLKADVLDPQGKVVREAAHDLGFRGVTDVRVGKHLWIRLNGSLSRPAADQAVRKLANQLLINPVIETFDLALRRG